MHSIGGELLIPFTKMYLENGLKEIWYHRWSRQALFRYWEIKISDRWWSIFLCQNSLQKKAIQYRKYDFIPQDAPQLSRMEFGNSEGHEHSPPNEVLARQGHSKKETK